MPQLQQVDSSMIHAIGYDPGNEELTVQFKKQGVPGATWQYREVPAHLYQSLLASPSIGKAFTAKVKGKYPGQPIS
jgi:hypothetical protein